MTKAAELAKMGEVLTNSQIGGRRNIIINGAMQVAQRATSASASNGSYVSLDRYISNVSGGGAYTLSQETDTPSGQGFKNSMKVNVGTADSSIASGDYYLVQYRIEGQDVAHLMLGTSDAVKVTLSFWVKSSLTGNFGASFVNSAANRSYPFQYNISSANTWQKITKTVQLDTSGTWLTDNGIGLKVLFDFGSGTTFQGTADAWGSANYHTASSSVQLIGTSGATWYITGVQLEVGSQATPFEHRSYGEELALCQRYCYVINGNLTESNGGPLGQGHMRANNAAYCQVDYPVPMRTYPTSLTVSDVADFQIVTYGISNNDCTTISIQEITERSALLNLVVSPTPFTVGDGANFTIEDPTNGQIIFEGAEL